MNQDNLRSLRRRAMKGDLDAMFVLGDRLMEAPNPLEVRIAGYGYIRQAAFDGHGAALVRIHTESELGGAWESLWETRQVSPIRSIQEFRANDR